MHVFSRELQRLTLICALLADPDSAVRLRGDPPRVIRLSRKAIGMASACGFAIIAGALIGNVRPMWQPLGSAASGC